MRLCLYFSEFILPFVIFYIVLYGYLNKVEVYEAFLKGAKDGFKIVISIAPTLIALLVSIGIFRKSGALDLMIGMIKPVGSFFHIPVEIIPVFIVRMFSSSAALSFVLDIFKEYGPDSKLGFMASIMMCCTETILYTMSVYYMSIQIKKTRWTFAGAFTASLAGALASILITGVLK